MKPTVAPLPAARLRRTRQITALRGFGSGKHTDPR